MNEYTPVEILRLQTATQLTVAFINKSGALTQEELKEVIDAAYITTKYLLEKCETLPDNRLRIPEGKSIILDSVDTTFYYEYTNQEGVQIRKKLGE